MNNADAVDYLNHSKDGIEALLELAALNFKFLRDTVDLYDAMGREIPAGLARTASVDIMEYMRSLTLAKIICERMQKALEDL